MDSVQLAGLRRALVSRPGPGARPRNAARAEAGDIASIRGISVPSNRAPGSQESGRVRAAADAELFDNGRGHELAFWTVMR